MFDATGTRDGTRLCDLGCGGGTASLAAVQRGASVTALDASAALLDVARERGNIFAELMETVKSSSLGQISSALYGVGGEYRRNM